MKEYIEQLYNEGLATTFYLKPIKYINKKVKNKKVKKILNILIKITYTLFLILILVFAIYIKFF